MVPSHVRVDVLVSLLFRRSWAKQNLGAGQYVSLGNQILFMEKPGADCGAAAQQAAEHEPVTTWGPWPGGRGPQSGGRGHRTQRFTFFDVSE